MFNLEKVFLICVFSLCFAGRTWVLNNPCNLMNLISFSVSSVEEKMHVYLVNFFVLYSLIYIYKFTLFCSLVNVYRFVLEPKSVLMEEQEHKFKDSEAAITSLQVYFYLVVFSVFFTLPLSVFTDCKNQNYALARQHILSHVCDKFWLMKVGLHLVGKLYFYKFHHSNSCSH